jgi:hypothetical protein
MDHKVSKDMISSGMIPSGEKTQADLGKTQYGSAPSPSKLMDAYKSMYDKKEEVINEMKMGDVSGSADFASRNIKGAKGAAKPSTPKPETEVFQGNVVNSKTGESLRKASTIEKVRSGRKEVEDKKGITARREKVQGIMNKYGESVDLLAAYRSIYEHHKKDADGNTIPHEDEELNEGKIPAGLQAYLDKKKGKKEDKKDVKEEIDTYDIVLDHFLNEGYKREDILKVMSTVNLTEEPITATLATIGAGLMKGAAVAAKGAMVAGKGAIAAGGKGLAAAGKGLAAGGKAAMKGVVSAAKPVAQSISKTASKATTGVKDITSKGVSSAKDMVGNVGQQIKKVTSQPTGGSPDDALNRIKKFGRDELRNKVRQELTKDREVEGTNKTAMASASKTNVAASADLFDIVKGQLLDEGLSEEEIKDIMLTLTPDEIMKEMNQGPSTPVSIDKVEFPKPGKKVMPKTGATYIGKVRPKPGFKMNPASGEVEKNENV